MKKKIAAVVFMVAWVSVLCIAGNAEQNYISLFDGFVYAMVAFVAIGISGAISGLLNFDIDKR